MWQNGAELQGLTGPALWGVAMKSDTAVAAAMTVIGVVVAAVASPGAVRGRAPLARGTALGGVVLAAASLLVVGRTRSADPTWLVGTAAAVHVAAGLTWVGGVTGLLTVLRRACDVPVPQATATLVRSPPRPPGS